MTASEVSRNISKTVLLYTSTDNFARDLAELSKFIAQGKPPHIIEKDWELLVRLYDKVVENLKQKIQYLSTYR